MMVAMTDSRWENRPVVLKAAQKVFQMAGWLVVLWVVEMEKIEVVAMAETLDY